MEALNVNFHLIVQNFLNVNEYNTIHDESISQSIAANKLIQLVIDE